MVMRSLASLVMLFFIALGAPAVQSQEKVKVSGAELEQWLSKYWVYAGTNDDYGCVFLIVSHSATKRDQYFDCPHAFFGSGTDKGTARVDGSRLCTKWNTRPDEVCHEVYRIGEKRYQFGTGATKFYILK
jgi:hypothetical protein